MLPGDEMIPARDHAKRAGAAESAIVGLMARVESGIALLVLGPDDTTATSSRVASGSA